MKIINPEEKEKLKERLKELINESNELSGKSEIFHYVIGNTYIKKRFLKNVQAREKLVRDRYNAVSLEIDSIYIQLLANVPKPSKEFLEECVKKAKIKYGIDY
jgi:hypothetical protein